MRRIAPDRATTGGVDSDAVGAEWAEGESNGVDGGDSFGASAMTRAMRAWCGQWPLEAVAAEVQRTPVCVMAEHVPPPNDMADARAEGVVAGRWRCDVGKERCDARVVG